MKSTVSRFLNFFSKVHVHVATVYYTFFFLLQRYENPYGKAKVIVEKLDEGKSQFRCPHCGKVYPYRDSAKKHVMSRHMNIKYSCSHCLEYTCTQSHMLKKHLKIAHGIDAPPVLTWNSNI